MFLDEAKLAARLNHPNVVQTLEVGQDGNRYFIAMEYLDGQPLNRIRARAGAAFVTDMQIRVLTDVLAGLHHAHELCDFDGTALGVVHRDATPQNVFVTYDGLIKVVDFGIAKAIDSSHETRTGMVKGKVTYMAPEQARGERVDRRADIFAVGVMLWEGIAGRRMWKGLPELTVVHDLIGNKVPSIRDAVPDVPDALARIVDRALAVNREDRYATAQDMHDALSEYLDGAGHTSAREVGKFVAERFGEDRAKVKALIESQLKDVRWSGAFPRVSAVDLPKIDPGQVMITPTGQKAIDGASIPGGPISASSVGGSLTNASASMPLPVSPPKPQKPVALIGVAAVAAIAVLGLGVRFLVPGGAPPASPGAAPAPSTQAAAPRETAPVPPPAPGQDAVKLTVHVSPPDAKIFLDDALLSAGAFEGKVIKNERPRRLRVEAPHHVSHEETVTLTGDVMLSFALDKEAPGAAAPPAVYAPRGGGRPVAAPEPAPAPRPSPPRLPRSPRPRRLPRRRPTVPRNRSTPSTPTAPTKNEEPSPRPRRAVLAVLLDRGGRPAGPRARAASRARASRSGAGAGSGGGEANAHFQRGTQLYGEADYNGALIEFRRAYEIDPRFQGLYNIGETYFQLQDYANALKALEKYLKDGAARISPGRRDEVQKTIERLRTRVANVEITTNLPDVEIAVYDVPVGKTPLPAPVLVSAGRRRITATRAGKPPVTQVVELAGGDMKKIALNVADDAPVVEAPAKVPAAPWVVTGLLAGAAIGTGAAALASSSTLKSDLAVFPNASSSQIASDHTKTFALALTTDVLIGAAVVAGAISIYFTATAGKRKSGDEKAAPAPAARLDPRTPAASPRVTLASPLASPPREEGAGPHVRLGAGPGSVLLSGTF